MWKDKKEDKKQGENALIGKSSMMWSLSSVSPFSYDLNTFRRGIGRQLSDHDGLGFCGPFVISVGAMWRGLCFCFLSLSLRSVHANYLPNAQAGDVKVIQTDDLKLALTTQSNKREKQTHNAAHSQAMINAMRRKRT